MSLVLEQGGSARQLSGSAVTPNLFDVLGIEPLLGRVFRDDENAVPLGEPVAILSERTWREQFGASSDVLGRRIVLNGRVFSVVGVMPRGFVTGWNQGFSFGSDIWIPAVMAPLGMRSQEWRESLRVLESPSAVQWVGVGRLRQGHDLSEARAEASVLSDQVRRRWPWPEADEASGSRPFVVSRQPG